MCQCQESIKRATLVKFSISISTTMFWNLMFIMAATVSSCERISVGPKMTPRLDTVIRLNWFCVETLQPEETDVTMPFPPNTTLIQTPKQGATVFERFGSSHKYIKVSLKCEDNLISLSNFYLSSCSKGCGVADSLQWHVRDKVLY